MAQALVGHEKSQEKPLKGTLISGWDVIPDRRLIAAGMRRFSESSMQKSFGEILMWVFKHVFPERLVFLAIMFEHCEVVMNTVLELHERWSLSQELNVWTALGIFHSSAAAIILLVVVPRVMEVVAMLPKMPVPLASVVISMVINKYTNFILWVHFFFGFMYISFLLIMAWHIWRNDSSFSRLMYTIALLTSISYLELCGMSMLVFCIDGRIIA